MTKFVTNATIRDGKPVHSDYNLARLIQFHKEREGKLIRITYEDAKETISDEKRRYYEGALVPAMRHFLNKERDKTKPPLTTKDTRDLIALAFHNRIITDNKGRTVKVPRSTTEMSNKKFGEFIELIVDYMAENGYPVPDPEEYKSWRDSAPPRGQRYFQDIWLPMHDPDMSIDEQFDNI